MKFRTRLRITSLLLCIAMLFSIMNTSPVFAYYEEPTAEGNVELETEVYDYSKPVGVTMQRLTGPCKTETGNLGDDFLFVIKSGDRYYAMKDVAASESDYESIPAVDVTDWINPDGSLTVPEDTLDVAFWRYEERDGYEYGVFINGREDYLGYSYSYEPTDGDDDYWNDSDRIYSGSFEVNTFEEGNWIMDPYYYSENDVSGTLKFNGTWDEKISTYRYITHRYEMITDIRSNGNGGKEFYFRYLGTDEKYTGEEVEGYLYYSDCRHQYTVRHAEYDAPTCMLKGCEEYWYCEGCNEYMKDENFNEHFGQEMPVIPALGHDWDSEKCNNCDRPVPVYSKVTNKADFDALADDTMYILVAEYEGKYYTPDVGEMYLYMMDSNGDGFNDIYDIDDNNNGISDMFEIDEDNDGNYDYLTWDVDGDGVITEIDMLEYHDVLCSGYLSDKLYGSSDDIPVKEIKINADGTISHEEVKDSVEFEMVDLYTDEDIDWMIEDIKLYEDWWSDDYLYTYECMKQFVIPNMYITAPSLLPMERQYKQRIADAGDTESWGVLFYNDAEYCKYYNYDLEAAVNVPFNDVCLEDSVAVFSAFDYYWHYNEEQLGQIRLRDYEETLSFVTGQAWELDGWEYVDDENGGYYDTHDTQACVYLYASQQISHVCDFGPWVEDNGTDTHTRTCKDESCGKTETNPHEWDEGVEIKAPKCDETGETKYTCIDCGATKLEEITSLGHEWSDWEDDGEESGTDSHTHICGRDKCGKIEQENHSWGDWVPEDENNHIKYCSECSGTRIDTHKWDNGVITTKPTEEIEGVKTYTCSDCGYTKTEPVDKLVHVHNMGEWGPNDEITHIRSCSCKLTETENHNFDEGVVINWATHNAPGAVEYTCYDCGYVKMAEIPIIKDHEWAEWVPNKTDETTHIRFCFCNETETAPHNFGNWTEQNTGYYERECKDCGKIELLGIRLTSDVRTIEPGKNVTLTATPVDVKEGYKYSYVVYNQTTDSWFRLADKIEANTFTWTAGSEGIREFYAEITDASGKTVRSEKCIINVTNKEEVALSISGKISDSLAKVGDVVTLTGTAEGGSESYTYSYIVYNKTTDTWARLADNIEANTFTWTAISAGDRVFYIDVKDSTGKVVRSNALNVMVEEETELNIKGSANISNTTVGENVVLTGIATGGSGSYTYSYIVYNKDNGSWFRLADNIKANTFTWIAGSIGNRVFYIDVKDGSGKVVRSNAIEVVTKDSSALSVSGSTNNTSVKVGTTVTIEGRATGGILPYVYSFLVYNVVTDSWYRFSDFTETNKISWTASSAGMRKFYVEAKDKTGTVVRSTAIDVNVN